MNLEATVVMKEKKEKVGPYEGQKCWRNPDGCVICNFVVVNEVRRYPKKAKYMKIPNGPCTCDKSKEPAPTLTNTSSS